MMQVFNDGRVEAVEGMAKYSVTLRTHDTPTVDADLAEWCYCPEAPWSPHLHFPPGSESTNAPE